jgi:hypothetical protein
MLLSRRPSAVLLPGGVWCFALLCGGCCLLVGSWKMLLLSLRRWHHYHNHHATMTGS